MKNADEKTKNLFIILVLGLLYTLIVKFSSNLIGSFFLIFSFVHLPILLLYDHRYTHVSYVHFMLNHSAASERSLLRALANKLLVEHVRNAFPCSRWCIVMDN